MENEKQETKIWKTIDELIAESNKTHFVEADYLGTKIRFAWKELKEGDIVEEPVLSKRIEDMNKEEKDKVLRDVFELSVMKMIEKAGKVENCTNDNVITKEQWMTMPSRIRMEILINVGNYKKSLQEDFL